MPEGRRVELDGISNDDSLTAEVYAHQGTLNGSQPKKLQAEALKLIWVGPGFPHRHSSSCALRARAAIR
jgi:hypothetical protein